MTKSEHDMGGYVSYGPPLETMNDLSDEAAWEYAKRKAAYLFQGSVIEGWQEARRRAEEGIKQMFLREMDARERDAFEAGFRSGQLIPKDSVYDGASALEQAWLVYQQGRAKV